MLRRTEYTGLVLAGGRGARMDGLDKGLQIHLGVALAQHAVSRLRPQVGELMIVANRNLDSYESMGVPVHCDSIPDHAGPLAGFLVGLEQCKTPYLVTVPCDAPLFPENLVEHLAQALEAAGAEIAIAATRESNRIQTHPVFCLMEAGLQQSLLRYLDSGQRKVDHWTALHRCVEVLFDDSRAFVNVNTPAELKQLQRMDKAFFIRRLAADDLRKYKALRDEMLALHPQAFTSDAQSEGHRRAEDYLPRLGMDRPEGGHLVLGAWDGPNLLGIIGLERDTRSKVRHIGHVVSMMVRPEAQGRGVGRALLEALIEHAREPAELEMLTLTVTAGNSAAIRLYERVGFTVFGTLRKAIKVGPGYHDKVHMVKYL